MLTNLFGKMYFWLEDPDKVTYLTKAKQNVTGYSTGVKTGSEQVTDGYVPDFS